MGSASACPLVGAVPSCGRDGSRGVVVLRCEAGVGAIGYGPIRGRATFDQLRAPTGRGRSGAVRARHVAAAHAEGSGVEGLAVGFALNRKFGSAVRRNRARRRMRAAVGVALPDLPSGSYLLSADPSVSELGFPELTSAVREAMSRAAAGTARGGGRASAPGSAELRVEAGQW
jgi:ribonuclease P protein component